MTELPRNLRYSGNQGKKYRRLLEDSLSPFKGTTFKDIFVYSSTYGFHNGLHQDVEQPQPNIPMSALSDAELWILLSLAIAHERTLDIVDDLSEAMKIAERYAAGGLEEVYLDIFGGKPGEPGKRMLQEVGNILDELGVVETASREEHGPSP